MRSLLSSYTNLVEIGRGGMATVYRATSATTGHLVAIKVLDMHLMNDPTARARFAQEASFQLTHPNIIRVIEHDVDARGSTPYIVMEYVAGESLEQRLQRQPKQDPKAVLPVLKDIASGLDYAHSQGVIHRDVKPNNILIRAKNGQALLADFGIAKTAAFTAYTATMARVGSVLFMSPEQAAGDPLLTPASDIYSLGVTAYYALSGRHPFEGEDQVAIARKHMDEIPMHPSDVDPNVPRSLGDVVMRALSKQPLQRPGSAGEFVQQMEKALLAPAMNAARPANGILAGGGVLPIGANAISSISAQVRNNAPAKPARKPLRWRWRLLFGALSVVIVGLLCGLLALLGPINIGGNGAVTNSSPSSSQASAGTASVTSTAANGAANQVQPTGAGVAGSSAYSLTREPRPGATVSAVTSTPNVVVLQTATLQPVVVIVSSVEAVPTLPPYVPEPTATKLPKFPIIIPTATQPLLFPPTAAPPTNTPLPPSLTPIPPTALPTSTPTTTPTPTTFSSPVATPTPITPVVIVTP